jgi:hypothetical protein
MTMFTTPVGCDHLGDAELVERFEALRIAPRDFRHREHVRLAFAMLAGCDLAEAGPRFKRALLRFAAAIGAEAKYHETLTWAYLGLVQERAYGAAYASSLEFIERNPDLLDHRGGALARCYDVEAITACPIARRVFVLPRT